MKLAIRYYSQTGNTKKMAEGLGDALGIQAVSIDEPITEPVDILFLGNSYYAFSIAPEVREFIQSLDKDMVGRIVNFGSAAMLNSTWGKVKKETDKKGIPLDEEEFHCKGQFKGIHKGRPNQEDVNHLIAFAKQLLEKEK